MNDSEQPVSETRKSAFVRSLIDKRKEAIDGRAACGIEQEWEEDEDYYQGIDDANRIYSSRSSAGNAKAWADSYRSGGETQARSTVFLNITRPYVDAASARLSDILLPNDDRAWSIRPTPIPRLSPIDLASIGGKEGLDQIIAQSRVAANGMQSEIDDCLVESNMLGECRHVLEDAARIGTGVIKGPYSVERSVRILRRDEKTFATVTMMVKELKPGSKRVDPWDIFPDPCCGESIHNGAYIWEREPVSARQLRDMADMPGYDSAEIFAALKEGAKTPTGMRKNGGARDAHEDGQFDLWIFHGACDSDDLEESGVEVEDESPRASAMAVLVNDRLIKATLNVLDSGEFPYDLLAWQRRPGVPWGTGVARHIRTIQRILNAAVRAMMDNSGLASGPQLVIGNGITPDDGRWSISGRKIWRAEADVIDVRQAFHAFVPPSVQAEMMAIIEWAMRTAEDATGIPAMLQGIRGDAPETLGGMQLQNSNAGGVMRRLAKRFDDYVTRPHIIRYYNWMMQHSDQEEIKGDYQIDVRASSYLVERDARQSLLTSLMAASSNPVYGLDPARLAAEIIRGAKIDPELVQYSPQERERMAHQSNPVENAKVDLLKAQARKTDSEAVNKRVEGMYSATSAANQIALNPTIAPMADQMLLSSGFEDKDSPPAIPAPQGDESAGQQQAPENTHPNFPPNPSVGMDSGIETGAGK